MIINKFDFTETDKKIAKTYFDAADSIFEEAKNNPDLSLKEKLNEDNEIDIKWISDAAIIEETLDENGNVIKKKRPIVDLVQQGGGMWGIALLGYCYIMEKVGIRFYSHGGTSAGAINALFLSSIPSSIYKDKPIIETNAVRGALKSELLTLIVSNMDFSSFMDRKGLVGKIQKQLFKNFNSKLLPIFLALSSLFIISGMYYVFGWFLNESGMGKEDIRYFSFIISAVNLVAFFFLIYIIFAKILGENFGLNTGDAFLKWVTIQLNKIEVNTTKDLFNKLSDTKLIRDLPINDLNIDFQSLLNLNENIEPIQKPLIMSGTMSQKMVGGKENIYITENPKLVLITSNLSHARIVRFPRKASDYWTNSLNINPATYARASMSLPFIFETFIPKKEHYNDKDNLTNQVRLKARMVDGGMLSNFPIREFHRTSNKPPSFPTFGVLLSKRADVKTENNLEGQNNSLLKYILTYIKTFRNFYDNDYFMNNAEIEKRVVTVDTRRNTNKKGGHINWLDFWMKTDDKRLLFLRGAEAAIRQLHKFEWEKYKELRIKIAKDEI